LAAANGTAGERAAFVLLVGRCGRRGPESDVANLDGRSELSRRVIEGIGHQIRLERVGKQPLRKTVSFCPNGITTMQKRGAGMSASILGTVSCSPVWIEELYGMVEAPDGQIESGGKSSFSYRRILIPLKTDAVSQFDVPADVPFVLDTEVQLVKIIVHALKFSEGL
jgi:hypothetical protein